MERKGRQPKDENDQNKQAEGENASGGSLEKLRTSLTQALDKADKAGSTEDARQAAQELTHCWARYVRACNVGWRIAGKGEPDAEPALQMDLVSFLLMQIERSLPEPAQAAGLKLAARLARELTDKTNSEAGGLPGIQAADIDQDEFSRSMEARLNASSQDDEAETPLMRYLAMDKEETMPRYSDMPDRDERGRFVSDHDRGRSYDDDRGRSRRDDDHYRSRSRYDDESDRRYSGGRESSARYDDDHRRSGRYEDDRGHGGWFGDPQGHSEASRRGWEHRRDDDDYRSSSSRGRSDYDDRDRDRDRYSRGGSHDDDRRYSRGGGEDHRGWYGDPQGHAEAARRGWEHRRDDDDDRYDRRRGGGGRY